MTTIAVREQLSLEEEKITMIRERLLYWYKKNHRKLP